MSTDSPQADRPLALDGTVSLPSLDLPRRLSLLRPRLRFGPRAARLALIAMMVGSFAVVMFATAGPSALVPRSNVAFPGWMAGPLHGVFGRLTSNYLVLDYGLTGVLVIMTAAYAVVLAAARTLSMRTIAICVVALEAILVLAPPMQLTDLFNYLGYARLGGLHGLNPYTHVIAGIAHDPVFRFTTWHRLKSPYGPMFTALSYPLSWLPLAVAYWVLKAATVLASLGFLALVWRCARQLGRDPRLPVLFVAANPIFLFYAVGGFHNDFFMLVPSMAAISLLLARRDRAAGAAVMLAVAVKFTAVLLLPFLLIAVPDARRRLRVVAGAGLAALPLAAMSVALFGFMVPNLQQQSSLLTDFSIPNLVGLLLGVGGGTPGLLRVFNVALVLVAIHQLRRNRNWLVGAGWSTLALIASLAWLMPWYVVWLLPLAAIAGSPRLRRAALALTLFLVITFIPATYMFMSAHGLSTMHGSAGQASAARQHKLQ